MKYLYYLILLILIVPSSVYGSYTFTQFTDPNFCSTYPSSYVTGSFALNETSNNGVSGFTKGQTNTTLIMGFSNASFEFNPGFGTVTATGTEVTIASYSITATTITVTFSTSSSNAVLNTITFNNVQVRATAAGTGYIKRTGGTFKIDNKTSYPASTTSWGNLTSGTPVAYSSSSATQAVTTSLFTGSTNNQIIGVQVVITGTCSSLTSTAFNFNTTGSTTPGTDLLNAKLYYTSTTNAFSTSSLFGSVSSPNGSFTINGSQALGLGAGTYYFWLTYDIAAYGVAVNSDLVDAQFVSSVIAGSTNAAGSGNPAGTRQISNNIFYSIATGNWSTTTIWSRTSGGASCSCAPTGGNGLVYVDHAITLDNSYTVNNVTVESGGNLSNAASKILTTSNILATTGSGVFAASTAWVISSIATSGTGTSTSSTALSLSGTLSVGAGSTLQMTGGVGLTVNGNMTIDGTLALGTSNLTNSNASGLLINGVGNITGSGTITLGVSKAIPTGTTLTFAPVISLSNGVVITNNGTVNMQNNITGSNATSIWTNAANSVLDMGGTASALMATGTLDASAVPNTVKYSGSGNQNIKTPSSSTYYNLNLSSSSTGVKSLQAALTVSGDLQISTGAQLDAVASGNTITLSGNWTNSSTNGTPFSPSTSIVYFSGTSLISGTGITSFYNVNITTAGTLTGNSSTGKVLVTGNWQNDGIFSHNSGDITFNGTSTISGTSITAFNTIIVNATKTLTLHATETDFRGDLTSNGTLNHNSGLAALTGVGTTQNINGSTSALTFYQLEVDNPSGTILLARPITINSTLTLTNGNITTDATNLLSLIAGSSIVSGSSSSFVKGPMKKTGNTSFIFPVGKSSTYAPITIGAPSLSTDHFTAEYFNSDPNSSYSRTLKDASLDHLSKAEYWVLSRTGGSSTVASTLSWGSGRSGGVYTLADLRVASWNGSSWKDLGNGGTTGDSTSGTVFNSSSVTTYSAFTLASSTSANPLPIALTSFDAVPMGNQVHLSWTTASEINNDYFTIERSMNGITFNELAKIDAAFNSYSLINYKTTDEHPFIGTSYYRLKQTDFNGQSEIFKPVAIFMEDKKIGINDIIIFPNPFGEAFTIRLDSDLNEELELKILNTNCVNIYTEKLPIEKGNNELHFKTPENLKAGIYLIQFTDKNGILFLSKMICRH